MRESIHDLCCDFEPPRYTERTDQVKVRGKARCAFHCVVEYNAHAHFPQSEILAYGIRVKAL